MKTGGVPLYKIGEDSDSELSQAWVRLQFSGAYLAVIVMLWALGAATYGSSAFPSASIYFVFGLAWVFVVKHELLSSKHRIHLSIVLDHSIFAIHFNLIGEYFAPLFWVPIFATIGYGLRFGKSYATRSIVISTLTLGVALMLSPAWREHYLFSIGLLSAGIALPFYSIKLADSIVEARNKAEVAAKQLELANRVDNLTGLFNVRGLEHQYEQCALLKTCGVLFYLDLDGFKKVNDTLGHHVGDEVLQDVSNALRKCVRSTDTIARLGGDEFAILFARLHDADAVEIAAKIIAAIGRLGEKWNGVELGISIGAASFNSKSTYELYKLLEVADQRMYEAKKAGKNRLCFPSADLVCTNTALTKMTDSIFKTIPTCSENHQA